MSTPYDPPSEPQQQPYGYPGYGPPSGPQPQQPYGHPGYGRPPGPNVVTDVVEIPGAGWFRLAGLGNRLAARLLDWLIIAVAVTLLGFLMTLVGAALLAPASGGGDSAAAAGFMGFLAVMFVYSLLVLVIAVLYEVWMIATRGATLGKQLLGIQVVREFTGRAPGWGAALARWAVPYGCNIIPCIGWIMGLLCWLSPTFDSVRKQGWHDKMAKTLVVAKR